MGLKARLKARARLQTQFLVLVAPAIGVIGRQDRSPVCRHIGAALRDDQAVIDRFRQIGEQRAHFLGAFKAMLRGHPPAMLMADGDALGDAQQGVVGLVHRAVGEIGNHWSPPAAHPIIGEVEQTLFHRRLDRRGRGAAARHIAGSGKSTVRSSERWRGRPPVCSMASRRLTGPAGPPVSAIKPSARAPPRSASFSTCGASPGSVSRYAG